MIARDRQTAARRRTIERERSNDGVAEDQCLIHDAQIGVLIGSLGINILARRRVPSPQPLLLTPIALRLAHEPVADCARLTTLSGEPAALDCTHILDLIGTLKLYGMRSAYDEVMATGIKRQHEPPPHRG
jgi:hypothetical protein